MSFLLDLSLSSELAHQHHSDVVFSPRPGHRHLRANGRGIVLAATQDQGLICISSDDVGIMNVMQKGSWTSSRLRNDNGVVATFFGSRARYVEPGRCSRGDVLQQPQPGWGRISEEAHVRPSRCPLMSRPVHRGSRMGQLSSPARRQ